MEREARQALDKRMAANHRFAVHDNRAKAENIFVNTSGGRRFHKKGMGQPRGGQNGKR